MKLDLEMLLRTLADRTRLRLLNLMRDHEICVCYLVESLDLSQPKISRHLAYLRRSGIVSARREGLWQHYSIVPPSDPALQSILKQALTAASQIPEAQKDIERMNHACCNPEQFVKLTPAPVPASPTSKRQVRNSSQGD